MCIFPAELVFKILYDSNPRDVLRWRTVSQWFYALTCDEMLWNNLYTHSTLPRPPGPSSSQSRLSLERMLVKSEQLARSWTTGPMRELSSLSIKLGQPLPTTHTLVSGRWLLGCEEARRFVLHNADPRAKTHARKVLWKHKKPIVLAWDAHSVSPVPGQSIAYVLLELKKQGSQQWKLLEFRLNDESGEIYDLDTIDPPAWAWGSLSRVELVGGKTRFLLIPTENPKGVVFDTQTRLFYAVPPWRVALPDTLPAQYSNPIEVDYRMAFTDTSILSLYYHCEVIVARTTLIQVFAIPSDVQRGIPTLCLTHEGFTDERLWKVGIVPCGVDPITGVTRIKLLDYITSRKDLKITCVYLEIPPPCNDTVSRISVDDMPSNNIKIPRQWIETSRYPDCAQYLDVGDGALLRGFYRGRPKQKFYEPVAIQHIMKFTIDTYQEPWGVGCSEIAPAEWRDAIDPGVDTVTGKYLMFDGLRGRLCYVHPEVEDEFVVVEIE